MKSFIIALIYAFVIAIVNGDLRDDEAKEMKLLPKGLFEHALDWEEEEARENKNLPKVVAINLKGKRTGTGTLINDLTILSANKCLNNSGNNTKDVTIHFPNDTKSYNVESIFPDDEIVIIKLDKNGNPPKCESEVKLSGKVISRTEQVVKIFHTEGKIDKYRLGSFDPVSDKNCFFRLEENNLKGRRCGYILALKKTIESDRGLPLFADGLLQGVVLIPQVDGNPIIYEELLQHRKFLEKYLNNSAKPEKPTEKTRIKEEKKTGGQKIKKEEKKPQEEDKNTKEEK